MNYTNMTHFRGCKFCFHTLYFINNAKLLILIIFVIVHHVFNEFKVVAQVVLTTTKQLFKPRKTLCEVKNILYLLEKVCFA